MTRTMPAAVITAPGQVEQRELPVPDPGPGQVRIRVHATGVCGTDLHLLHGHFGAQFPLVAGHEISGTVDAVGAGVLNVREGDPVTVDPNLYCGQCHACQRGLFQHCEHHEALGVTLPGGFATHTLCPATNVYPAHGLTLDQAAFAEPLGCVAWGMQRLRPRPGSTALVFGAGAIGLLLMQGLQASGCSRVTVVDPVEGRLALARTLGATHTLTPHAALREELLDLFPHGFDVTSEATGVPDVVQGLPALTAVGGSVLVFGVAPEGATVALSPYDLFQRDLTVLGSFALNQTVPLALEWLRAGRVNVDPLITHRLPLTGVEDALNMKARPGLQGAQKVLISPHAPQETA
ncbi:zinc-dependent alcohol dehydrogenase family protein (plasmid) [Deinococcus taeanensis]|uniref:zinc-dependent alcohol dehydrogenase family protein n=1 Tax=Deinococcus taeanensis TaxID=2737050 RepID=UPI001CDCC820|nr:zinc-dependent alcohol dehydrogenase family protein [Deinococcus taeanensis]UBV45024.1 zinc-dependent alcohol dehydrogenase family protein [Deinococcus taeanensis]